ncbi:hypothetical protein ACFSTI_17685 [Rhizorhabdus histidinilytica]
MWCASRSPSARLRWAKAVERPVDNRRSIASRARRRLSRSISRNSIDIGTVSVATPIRSASAALSVTIRSPGFQIQASDSDRRSAARTDAARPPPASRSAWRSAKASAIRISVSPNGAAR